MILLFQTAIKLSFEARYYKVSNFAISTSSSGIVFGWICDVDKLQQNIKQIFRVHRVRWQAAAGWNIHCRVRSEVKSNIYNTHVCEMPRNKFCVNKRQTMFDYIVKQMFLPQMQTSLRKRRSPLYCIASVKGKSSRTAIKIIKTLKQSPASQQLAFTGRI